MTASLLGRIPNDVLSICRTLEKGGFRGWIVGGCLRDLLLGKDPSDWDVATSARPEQVKKLFRRVIPTGIEHGTVTVIEQGKHFEVTTLRGEGAYTDGRRPDEVFFVQSIEEDLARRDFTVNAIAFDPVAGAIADPFGGEADLHARRLRAVGDAAARFGEDGLRVLRAARFVATLEFALDPATEAAIAPSLETFRKVSPERVRDEWLKTMKARRPSRAFDVMARTGILDVTYPDLASLRGCAQNKWHAYDVWGHSMECLDACAGDPILRVAALLHDVGKPATRAFSDKTQDYTFYDHEKVGADMADRWLRTFRFSNDERGRITHLIRHHLVCYSAEWTDSAVRRFMRRVGIERLPDLLALARADALGKGRPVDGELAALAELSARCESVIARHEALGPKDLAIDGRDVITHLGIAPGRMIGRVLDALVERVLEDPALNERERLLALASEIAPGLPPSEK